jgi:hypothetical protein
LLFKESRIRVFLEAARYFRAKITAIKLEIKIQNLQIERVNWKQKMRFFVRERYDFSREDDTCCKPFKNPLQHPSKEGTKE